MVQCWNLKNVDASPIMKGIKGRKWGTFFMDRKGLEIFGGTWRAFRHREIEPFTGSQNEKTEETGDMNNHWANFITAIRSGKNDLLLGDINEGFISTSLCHLGNISYRLGRQLKFDGITERFINDPEAYKMLTRVYREPYIVPDNV